MTLRRTGSRRGRTALKRRQLPRGIGSAFHIVAVVGVIQPNAKWSACGKIKHNQGKCLIGIDTVNDRIKSSGVAYLTGVTDTKPTSTWKLLEFIPWCCTNIVTIAKGVGSRIGIDSPAWIAASKILHTAIDILHFILSCWQRISAIEEHDITWIDETGKCSNCFTALITARVCQETISLAAFGFLASSFSFAISFKSPCHPCSNELLNIIQVILLSIYWGVLFWNWASSSIDEWKREGGKKSSSGNNDFHLEGAFCLKRW